MNRVILLGHLTKDPEVRYTADNKAVANFTVATDRRTKEKTTDFHSIVAWEKTAEFVGKYLTKGQMVVVEGEIRNRNYEKEGRKIYVTEIYAHNIEFADSKKSDEGSFPREDDGPNEYNAMASQEVSERIGRR